MLTGGCINTVIVPMTLNVSCIITKMKELCFLIHIIRHHREKRRGRYVKEFVLLSGSSSPDTGHLMWSQSLFNDDSLNDEPVTDRLTSWINKISAILRMRKRQFGIFC